MSALDQIARRVGPVADACSRVCGALSAAMIVAAVAITCQLIFARFVLNLSTVWQTELVVYLMIGATTIGLPYVQYLRGHVNVDLLPMWLSPARRRILAFFTLGLSLIVVLIIFWHGAHLALTAFERGWRSETVWGAQLWIPYLMLPVGFGLFALQIAADLLNAAARRRDAFGHGAGVEER